MDLETYLMTKNYDKYGRDFGQYNDAASVATNDVSFITPS